MSEFPNLSAVQTMLWRLITAPEGAAQGARTLRDENIIDDEDLAFLVNPDAKLGATERVDIYADMYFYRLLDCLAEDFPKTKITLGDTRFHNLVTDYLLAHPPSHFSLRELGRAFPEFASQNPVARECPLLADLAALEWARVDVFDAADTTPLSRQGLFEKSGRAPDEFVVALIPASRLIGVQTGVLPLWRSLDWAEEGATPDAAQRGADTPTRTCTVRIWRKGFSVFHRSTSADEEGCLRILEDGGATLAELGERVSEKQPPDASPDSAGERLAALLALWTDDELLTAGAAP